MSGQIPHVDWIGFLIVFGIFLHTLACMLIIVAIRYCPKWFLPGWIALCVATLGVFFRRVGYAYAMIEHGVARPFFFWEYWIYCVISICWAICGLQMILHGREHGDIMTHTSGSTTTSYKTSSRAPRDDGDEIEVGD